MTENEAIKWLREMQNPMMSEAELYCAETCYGLGKMVYPEPEDYVFETAIQALEEIEQYRAIGTVERFRFLQEVCDLNGDELENIANSMIELKNYRAIGTIDEFKDLKEKVEPKKPLPKGTHKGIDNFYCPNCNHPLTNRHEQCELPYCDICGQKLDWSE